MTALATAVEVGAPILTVRGLDVSYGQTQVLFGVDLDVADGEILALLGTNGAGKSTLLKAVIGSVRPGRGKVTFDGRDITKLPADRTVALGIAMVPGGKGVFPGLTVAENVNLAGWLFRDKPQDLAQATDDALSYFPILRERWDQKAGNMSGGEQQMLCLTQAFMARPKLLIIDELSLGLAPLVVEQLLNVVRAIHETGTTVILVEQSVNVALTLAKRAVFMEKGEIRFDGPTADLLDRPDILRSVFLEGAASVAEGAPEDAETEAKPVYVRPVFKPHCDECGREQPLILETREIAVSFGGIRAVNGASLDVRQSQILGLIGPNGAGKTTIFDLVSGYLTPSEGRVFLAGTDVTSWTPDARARAGLGRSFQDARLFQSMTVQQVIAVAFERHIRTRDALATILMSPATKMAEEDVAERVDELIVLMRLPAFANKFISELSTGTRRIVDLACCLAHDPKVLLLDEPSSGIAQRETEALGPVLLDIRDKLGAGMIVIEHDMPLITGISDEMIALELGRPIARGTPDEVVNDPHVVESYLGGSEEVIHRSGEVKREVVQESAEAVTAPTNGKPTRRRHRARPT